MKIKGLISEDFVNYKKPAMTIMFPHCNGFKCGAEYCQNSPLSKAEDIEMDITDIVISHGNETGTAFETGPVKIDINDNDTASSEVSWDI